MKAILTVHNIASDFVTSFWTPVFVGIFHRHRDLRPLAAQQGRLRRSGENAVARGVTPIMTEHSDFDHVSGRSTTGHEWDGIKELNTPLPRWWVITFYLTIRLGDRLLDRVSGVAAALEPYHRHLELLHARRRRRRTRQSGKDPRRQDGGARRGAAGGDREGSRLAGAGARPRQDGVRRQLRAMPRQRRRRRQGLSQSER